MDSSSQALSKRIHYGKFVAEAKFQASPEAYEAAIKEQVFFFPFPFFFFSLSLSLIFTVLPESGIHNRFLNGNGGVLQDKQRLMDMLTYQRVEDLVKKRVEMKTRAYGQEVTVNGTENEGSSSSSSSPVYKIKPELVADLYGDWIMPLTKEVQVAYLLRRLD